MKIQSIIYSFICLFLLTSCDGLLTSNTAPKQKQTSKKQDIPQGELLSKLEASTKLLQNIITKPDAKKELRYAINFYSKNNKVDQRVNFSAMFDKNAAYKKAHLKKKGNSFDGAFAQAFQASSSHQKAKRGTSFTAQELLNFLKDQRISVYFPYRLNWKKEDIIPTLTYHPLDNEDVNQGWKPVSKNSSNNTVKWEKVTVNDDYAYKNPTMILVPCNAGRYTDSCTKITATNAKKSKAKALQYDVPMLKFNSIEGGGGSGGGLPPCLAGKSCAHSLQIGWARLTHQYDGLFAGGSEIKWASIDAVRYLPDYSVDTTSVYTGHYFSRRTIRKKRWQRVFSQLDQDWENYELAKEFKAYEADGGGTATIKLNIKVDLGPVKPSLGVDLDLSDDRANLFKTNYYRSQFMSQNHSDLGSGMKDGVALRGGNNLYWTMPILEFGY